MPKIPAYPPLTTPDDADEIIVNDASASNATKRMTLLTLFNWIKAKTLWVATGMIIDAAVTSAKLDRSTLYSDTYTGTSLAAPGEFVNTTRKTFDISSLPVGAVFVVAAVSAHTDSTYGNARSVIIYNGVTYSAQNYGQYGISGSTVVTLKKVSGQNSITVQNGGNRVQSMYATITQSM